MTRRRNEHDKHLSITRFSLYIEDLGCVSKPSVLSTFTQPIKRCLGGEQHNLGVHVNISCAMAYQGVTHSGKGVWTNCLTLCVHPDPRQTLKPRAVVMSEPKAPTPAPGDTYKGWLFKWTNYIKGYQRRWFVLSNGLLSYYRWVCGVFLLFNDKMLSVYCLCQTTGLPKFDRNVWCPNEPFVILSSALWTFTNIW